MKKSQTNFYEKFSCNEKTLLKLLEEKAMTRKEMIKRTNWTRGQIGGVLLRAQRRFLVKLTNHKFSLIKKPHLT